jgi:hypothetical protein
MAGKSPKVRSYMVYIFGSGQLKYDRLRRTSCLQYLFLPLSHACPWITLWACLRGIKPFLMRLLLMHWGENTIKFTLCHAHVLRGWPQGGACRCIAFKHAFQTDAFGHAFGHSCNLNVSVHASKRVFRHKHMAATTAALPAPFTSSKDILLNA